MEVKQSVEAGVKTPAQKQVVDMISGVVEPPALHPLPKQASVSLVSVKADAAARKKKSGHPEQVDFIGRKT